MTTRKQVIGVVSKGVLATLIAIALLILLAGGWLQSRSTLPLPTIRPDNSTSTAIQPGATPPAAARTMTNTRAQKVDIESLSLPFEPPIPEYDDDGMPLDRGWVPDPENYIAGASVEPVPAPAEVYVPPPEGPNPAIYIPPSDNPGGVNGDRPPRLIPPVQ